MESCTHADRKACSACQRSYCPVCQPGERCRDCAYDSLSQRAEVRAQEVQAAAPPAPGKPVNRMPVLVVLLVVWGLSLAWSVPRLGPSLPPITYEQRLVGAVTAMLDLAGLLDQLAEGDLPGELRPAAEVGLQYERLDERSWALSARIDGEQVRLESRAGTRSLSGKGTEVFTRQGAQGGPR